MAQTVLTGVLEDRLYKLETIEAVTGSASQLASKRVKSDNKYTHGCSMDILVNVCKNNIMLRIFGTKDLDIPLHECLILLLRFVICQQVLILHLIFAMHVNLAKN